MQVMRTVALISPGDMGQAVGILLARGGERVVTCLARRSERTRGLARAAGFIDMPSLDVLVRESEMILSIVPPAQAVTVARDVAAALRAARAEVTYVDCNAISPRTAREVAAVIAPTGSGFVDAGIVGGPPRDGPSPRFYASGPGRERLAELRKAGLDVRVLGADVGEASAVKMCYAALTKGTTAIATELLVAARKLGVYDTLVAELQESQPTQAKRMGDAVPAMPGKAHRWIAEMEEIARTFEDVGLTPLMFQGAAEMYRLTAESEIGGERPETVDHFRGVDGTVDVLARASEKAAAEKVPTK
jgi:3-hydroxyisobutyrate dehydrogenase-like beta-hydroxyacid dehydrogenase